MEYFAMKSDNRLSAFSIVKSLSTIKNYRPKLLGDITPLNPMSIGFVNYHPKTVFPDFDDRQFFMVKDKVKEVFDMFLPNIHYKAICLLNNENDIYEYYFLPQLSACECLINKNDFGYEAINHKIFLKQSDLPNSHIFIAKNQHFTFVCCTLLVAEAIRRRQIDHVQLIHINKA